MFHNNDLACLNNKELRFVVWGTGEIFQKISSEFNLDINKQVICFIETEPQNSILYEKKILSLNDYLEMYSKSKDSTRILIASSYTNEIYKMLKKSKIDEELIYNGYKWYVTKTEGFFFPIVAYQKQCEDFLNQGYSMNEVQIDSDNEVVVFVKNWAYSLMPYYQITLGILLRMKGMKVKFLFDDCSRYDDLRRKIDFCEKVNSILEKHLNIVKEKYGIPYERLSDQEPCDLTEFEEKRINRSIYLNKIWETRKTIFDEVDNSYYGPIEEQFRDSSKKIKGFLVKEKPKKVFAFTAIHLEFALLNNFCSMYNIQVYSTENFRSSYSYSISGPAVSQKDIALFNEISLSSKDKEYLIGIADKHMEIIINNISEDIIKRPYVLIPLNIFWDSAAFTENDAFETVDEWLIKTINFLIDECRITVIIRQHPHEKKFGTGKDLREKLIGLFKEKDEFIFISDEENVNTYTLIKYASLILPNTTTVGIESAILEKTVIVKNNVYYSESGFVLAARTQEEYFKMIQNELSLSTFDLSGLKVEKAKLSFALSSLLEIPKTFGHDTEDVLKWIDSSFEELLNDQSVEWLTQSVKEHKPLLFHKLGIEGVDFNV